MELAHYLSDQADAYVSEEAAQAKHMAQMAKQQQEGRDFRAKKREEDKAATANLAAKVAARRGKPHVSKEALAASMAKKNVARARRLARVTGNGGDDDGGGGKSNAAAVDPNSLEARVAARNAEVVKVGDKVMLAPGQADTEVACGVLTEGEIGVVVHLGWTDGMESPCVRGVAGHKWWYKRHQITLAPAARKEKIAGPPPAQPRAPWSPNNFHTSKTTSLE